MTSKLTAGLLALFLTGAASAQCGSCSTAFSTFISTSEGDSATVCCNFASGAWDIVITGVSDGGNNQITVVVQANSSGTVIDDITVYNNAGSGVTL